MLDLSSAHGSLNVVGAIQHSCNDFFYEVGYRLGQDENGNYDSSVGLENLKNTQACSDWMRLQGWKSGVRSTDL